MNALDQPLSRPREPANSRPLGLLEYGRLLRPDTVQSPADALRACLTAYPDIFADAAIAFSPQAWRLLVLCSTPFDWPLLIDPVINFRERLRDASETGLDVPQEWLDGDDPRDVADSLRQDLAYADEDSARAAWLVLAFVRGLRLETPEKLRIPWWKPQWLQQALMGA